MVRGTAVTVPSPVPHVPAARCGVLAHPTVQTWAVSFVVFLFAEGSFDRDARDEEPDNRYASLPYQPEWSSQAHTGGVLSSAHAHADGDVGNHLTPITMAYSPLASATLSPELSPRASGRAIRACAKCGATETPKWRKDTMAGSLIPV